MKKVFTKMRYLLALVSMVLMGTTVATAQTLVEAWSAGATAPEAETRLVDNDLVTVATVYATTAKEESQTFGGKSFTHYIQFRTSGVANADNPTGGEDTGSTPLVITAKQDVNVTFYYRRQKGTNGYDKDDNKDMLCYAQNENGFESGDNVIFEYSGTTNDPEANAFVTKTYKFVAGGVYTMYRGGSTMRLYGFDVLNPKQVVNADIDCKGTITDGVLAGAVNTMKIGTGGAATEIVNNSYMKLGDHDNIVTIPEEELAGARDIIEVSFDMAWGDKENMGNGITIKDAEGETIAYFKYARWATNGTNGSNLGIDNIYDVMGDKSGSSAVWNNRTHFVITIDYAQKTISTVATLGNTTKEYMAALTNTNPMESFAVYGYNAGGNADRAGLFGNLVIKTTEGNYDVATANYTVKWVEGESVVKEETREGDVDSEISLLPADLASFFEGDVKYIVTENDAAGKTVAADGTTVVTISVRKAETWPYTVNAVSGEDILKEIATGTALEGEMFTLPIPRLLNIDGTIYTANIGNGTEASRNVTMNENPTVVNVDMNATTNTNVIYFSEAEDIETLSRATGGNVPVRCSFKAGGYASDFADIVTLPAGSYKITAATYAGKDYSFDFVINADTVFTVTGTGSLVENSSKEFTLTGEATLTVKGGNGSNALDYIYVTNTAISTTITSAGWATLYSDKPLDFSGTGLTAYIATYNDANTTVTLTQVDDVPANTGVVLQGAEGSYTIPVIANPSNTKQGDMSGSTTEDVAYDKFVGEEKDMYVLSLNNDKTKVQFRRLTSGSSAKGKAYLLLPSTLRNEPNRVLSVVFGDDTTGINEAIVNGEQKAAGTYNLNGQRVAQPTKGLYIVNGKKVIIK